LKVAADAGCRNPAYVALCEESGITPYVPAPNSSKNAKQGLFTKEEFSYDKARDAYRYPAGEWLTRRTESTTKAGRTLGYYSNPAACRSCPIRMQCARSKDSRRLMRPPEEAHLAATRKRLVQRPDLMVQRKATVEHPLGTMKRCHDAGYFLLKGLEKTRGEFSLSVLTYNLRRVMNLLGVECLLEALQQRQTSRERALRPCEAPADVRRYSSSPKEILRLAACGGSLRMT